MGKTLPTTTDFAVKNMAACVRLSTLQLTLTREIHTMAKVYQKQSASIKTGKHPMKPTIQIFKYACCLLLLALAGCTGDPDRARIVGDWEIATADHLMGQINAQPDGSTDTPAPATNQPPRMLIHFYNSGYLTTETNMGSISTQKQGNWKFLAYDAQTQTAKIQCKLVDDTTDFDVVVLDDNTLRLVPPNMAGLKTKLKFVRQQ